MKGLKNIMLLVCLFLFCCTDPTISEYEETGTTPDIYPDYIDVTIPVNIAPLNFHLRNCEKQGMLYLEGNNQTLKIFSDHSKFSIASGAWRKLLLANKGKEISLTVFTKEKTRWKKYQSFSIKIATDPIDPVIVYRLIEPGYELWEKMGIYQRNLENFKETAIYENKMTDYNCVNCHSFCMQNPDKMLLHLRGDYGGTILLNDGNMEKLDTKTDSTISSFVYPAWHPSGKYIAFSVNNIAQSFYLNNKNRLEVFDSKSDLVMYDIQKREVFSSPLLSSANRLETFPGFSPDGKKLYFCSAKSFPVPQKSDSVKYSLCSVSFDINNRIFGQSVDTVYNARNFDKSVSFPRISPDGNFLLFTTSGYGTFPIWHKDADLSLYNLKEEKIVDMQPVNSDESESYHSWSSNSRWIVFSSRRDDGLYTRLYIAHLASDGRVGKAFMLPQKDSGFYNDFLKSYNIPEFATAEVHLESYSIARQAKFEKGESINYVKTEGFHSGNQKY